MLQKIQSSKQMTATFNRWKPEQQEEFLDFCTGVKGVKILYDSFFKEVLNPEYEPEHLENLLMSKFKKSVICFQENEVPVILRICFCGNINEFAQLKVRTFPIAV